MAKKKLTTEEFIAKANITHNGKYGYSSSNYNGSSTKLSITCSEHGDFEQRPADHLKGQGCPKCGMKSKTLSTEEFIERAKLIHGSKYTYSRSEYTKSYNKITITCSIHGDFKIQAGTHLIDRGCPKCGISKRSENMTKSLEDFILQANKVHAGKYSYIKTVYKKSGFKVVIGCPIHGDFEQEVSSHLNGNGCFDCGRIQTGKTNTTTVEDFMIRANKIHDNKYTYEKVNNPQHKNIVIITCLNHGDFKQEVGTHLKGYGCIECSKLSKGWGRSHFKMKCDKNNNGSGILYIIKCFDKEESFIKVGITSRSIDIRYKTSYQMPYNYEIIYQLESDPIDIYETEDNILRELKDFKYKPNKEFAGLTECLANTKEVQDYINSKYNNIKKKLDYAS